MSATPECGARLRAVANHLQGEEMFLADYADRVGDLPLPTIIETYQASDAVAKFVAVRPTRTFHLVQHDDRGMVTSIGHVARTPPSSTADSSSSSTPSSITCIRARSWSRSHSSG